MHLFSRPENSLEQVIYRTFFGFSLFLMLLSTLVTLYIDITNQRKLMDRAIAEGAAYIAELPSVRTMIQSGYPTPATVEELDIYCNAMSDINAAVIYNSGGLRFYHTNRSSTGESYLTGEEQAILEGAEPYITSGYSTLGKQRRAFHAVRDGSGAIIGFVMISIHQAEISASLIRILLLHMGILICLVPLSLFMTNLVLSYIRSRLKGRDPNEILTSYYRQDTVINALEEGLIAVKADGTILYSNNRAREFLNKPFGSLRDRPITNFIPDSRYEEILRGDITEEHRSAEIGGHSLIISEVPIMGNERQKNAVTGVLLILQDRTESLRLSDELSGARSMMDTMRAFNHEFLNKLHVILGYLQIGDIETAKQFIINSSLVSSQSIRETANAIRDSRICALVIGKMMHAAELGITLRLSPDSMVLEQDLLLSQTDCVTIIGNLLENAVEELSSCGKDVLEIELGLHFNHDINMISCEDTGRGIPEELLPKVREMGVSSKSGNRGTGLFLIDRIVTSAGGTLEIETEPGEGTCITIVIRREDIQHVPGSDH